MTLGFPEILQACSFAAGVSRRSRDSETSAGRWLRRGPGGRAGGGCPGPSHGGTCFISFTYIHICIPTYIYICIYVDIYIYIYFIICWYFDIGHHNCGCSETCCGGMMQMPAPALSRTLCPKRQGRPVETWHIYVYVYVYTHTYYIYVYTCTHVSVRIYTYTLY